MTKLSGPARRELTPVSCSNATHGPDEGLAVLLPVLEQVALDRSVRAGVAVLVAETAAHLHGGVSLLGGSVLALP